MNVSEQIRLQCERNGSEPALSYGGVGPDTTSYAKLGHHVDTVSIRLARLGVSPGLIYGIRCDAPLIHVVLLLALERLGAASATVRETAECEAVRLAAVFSDRDIPGAPCPVFRVSEVWFFPDDDFPPPPAPHAFLPNQLCRIAFTSGSTGRPKPIALTYGMRAERLQNQNLAYGETFARATRRLCSIGINTGLGYRILIRTLSEGGLFCFPEFDIPRTGRRIAMYQVQALIGSPLQLADFASHGEAEPGAFAALELIVCTGSRLSPALAEKLRRHVCSRVLISYGSSEGGIVAAGSVEDLNLGRGEVGRVIARAQAEILDEDGHPVIGSVGRVRVRVEGGAQSYHGREVGAGASFDQNWFYPGDLGILSAGGMLSIVGREDNVLNFGGVKTTLEAAEAELLAAPAVKDVAVKSIKDDLGNARLVALIVPQNGWSESAFFEYCRAKIDHVLWPIRVVLLPGLPRRPNGKIDRQALAAMDLK